jgi:hypothetical protein
VKIEKISMKDFRGFPHEETFNLGDGKNLLVYGENGSGKSSLYHALVEFFKCPPGARSFGWQRNVFSSGPNYSALDGHITLQLSDGVEYQWKCLGTRPLSDPAQPQPVRERLVDASNRAAMLDYRSLLRTNFGAPNLRERLFDLTVTTLLVNAPVPVAGGGQRTIGQLWQALLNSKPRRHTKPRLRVLAAAEQSFNEALRGILPEVEKKASDFLSYFADSGLELRLGLPGVHYRQYSGFTQRELDFEVKLRGVAFPEWNDLLNEARLTALALSLYLSGASLRNTAPPAEVGTPLRLLVLDDVLIGLDLAHRLPVLRIVEERFADFQVVLLTFDRAWYEVAKQQLPSATWCHYELFTVHVGDHEQPLLRPDLDHLYRALAFLDAGEVKAASVHVRTAFELVLKYACQQLGLGVKFQSDPRKVPASDLWSSLKSAQYDFIPARQCAFDGKGKVHWWQPRNVKKHVVVPSLQKRIEHAISWVLNPLSHSQTVDRYRAEIEDAIYAIDDLERAVKQAVAVPLVRQTIAVEEMISLLKAYIAKMATP